MRFAWALGMALLAVGSSKGQGTPAKPMPTVTSMPAPEFSEEAKRDKKGGTVLVGLDVDEAGLPTHVRVLRGIGYGLDEKAVEAVKQYKFKPAMKDGHPVKVSMNIAVNFEIIDKPPAPQP